MHKYSGTPKTWDLDSIIDANTGVQSWGQFGARFGYFDVLSIRGGSMMSASPFWGPFTNTGECYAFDYEGLSLGWRSQYQMSAAITFATDKPKPSEEFPTNVSMFDSDTVAIGSRRRPSPTSAKGTVWVMRRLGSTGTWYTEAKIDNPSGLAGDQNFGRAVALGDGILIVGASGWDFNGIQNTGAVFVYKYNSGIQTWDLDATFVGPDTVPGDAFGRSVSLHGHNLLIGAIGADLGSKANAGAGYLYHLNGGNCPASIRNPHPATIRITH